MKLLQLLNEASDLPIEEIKERMKKDPRVKILFSRDADFEDVKDPKALILTVKYYIFNNRNVREFANSRFGIKSLSRYSWNKLEKLKPDEFTSEDFDDLKKFISDLFRDYTRVAKNDIEWSTFSEALAFIQGNRLKLSDHHVRELESLNLGIEQPIRLYHSIYFSPRDFESRIGYDKNGNRITLLGAAVKFLNSIKSGSRLVRLEKTEHSVWTTDKKAAVDEFDSPSSSKMQDGAMGFVISMLARPKDVLLSAGRFIEAVSLRKTEKYDNLYVVRPGKYLTRIVHKFTSAGEVDPTQQIDDSGDAIIAAEQLQLFAQVFQPYYPLDQDVIHSLSFWASQNQRQSLHLLEAPDAREKLLQNYEDIINFYKDDVEHLSVNDIKELHSNPQYLLEAEALDELRTAMQEKYRVGPGIERVRWADLTTDQFLETLERNALARIGDAFSFFARDRRYTDRDMADVISSIRRVLGLSSILDLHRKSKESQKQAMSEVIEEIHRRLGKEMPESRVQQVANAVQYVKYVNVNARIQAAILRLFNEKMRKIRANQLGE